MVGLKQRQAADSAHGSSEGADGQIAGRIRGGFKQRRLDSAELPAEQSSGSTLSNLGPFGKALIKDWGAGRKSAKQIQQDASNAQAQGATGLEGLAKLGTSGKNPQNIFRDMQAVLGYPEGAPRIQWFEIPTKSGRRTPHPFLLPHCFFC